MLRKLEQRPDNYLQQAVIISISVFGTIALGENRTVRYIYMHNFRGFTDTLIPLAQTSFLVGENSTGKTSFLKLISLLSTPQFWFSPEFTRFEITDLGGFRDIVSAGAADRSHFQVGDLTTREEKPGVLDAAFAVYTFVENDGIPQLSRYIFFADKIITTLVYESKDPRYQNVDWQREFSHESEIKDFFKDAVQSGRLDMGGLRPVPETIPRDVPPFLAIQIVREMGAGKKSFVRRPIPDSGSGVYLNLIAPIRSKPRRLYEALGVGYSSEGAHAPYVLRSKLQPSENTPQFVEKLKAFGDASGLFETIDVDSFGEGPLAPFEVQIKFSGVPLNIANVGYGVSQILPLIVEFLANEKDGAFAVQQPEVHLHPRAQAALGDLIYQLAKERGHSFLLETHSDYLLDRYRLAMSADENPPDAQVLFFTRGENGNHVDIIPISPKGRYQDQPRAFRDFFIREEMALMEI